MSIGQLISSISPLIFMWLVLIIVFIVGEMLTVGLTSIWFAAGAFVALLAAILGWNIAAQVVLFLVVSVGLLAATKPWAKRFINGHTQKTNADRTIGQVIRIEERVSNMDQTGMAVVSGQEWTVRTCDDSVTIEAGEYAKVVEIRGVKLIVEKV